MAYDEHLAGRIRDAVAGESGIEEKKMFGGVGFLLGGNMLVGVWKDSLIARVGPEAYPAALKKRGVSEFDITGRAMAGWVLIDPSALKTERQLGKWIDLARSFVKTLPKK
jgi:TfoX/Sxy family transcriptional regulator of competence genes